MSSKNVAIQRSVYDALAREKREGESFTDLFVRLLHQRGAAEEIRGSWGTGGAIHDRRQLAQLRRESGGRGP